MAAREGVLGPDHLDVIGRALTGLSMHVPPQAIAEAGMATIRGIDPIR